MSKPLALALVHHPVVDRRGDLVTTAVTNLDIHDIARTARTFGVSRFYVVTPAAEQRVLVGRILDHWCSGFGAGYNPDRGEALSLVCCVETVDEALQRWAEETGEEPAVVLTSARQGDLGIQACREMANRSPLLLLFGTGWGMAPELFQRGWPALEPIRGSGDYNHLPVRAAAAIILDRLRGERVQQ